MSQSQPPDEPLITDNLESLKEGEVFVDKETGKKYRVKKTILPHYASAGPHGLGNDVEDYKRRGDPSLLIYRTVDHDYVLPLFAHSRKAFPCPTALVRRLDVVGDSPDLELYSKRPQMYSFEKSIFLVGIMQEFAGDPDDRTLRRIEADVIIPNRMNARIEKVECHESYMDLVNCMREKGAVKGLKLCKPELGVFNHCKFLKFNDTEFRERMTEEYLQERSEARRTGMTARQRKLEAYREWKKEHESS